MPAGASHPAGQRPDRLAAMTSRRLKAKIGDEISALVLDSEGASHAFQRLLGVFIAECRGPLVVGFRRGRILRPAAAFLGERAHPLQRAGVILPRRLLEESARAEMSHRRSCNI